MVRTIAPTERELPSITRSTGSAIVLLAGVFFSFGGLAFRSVEIGSWEYLFYRGFGMGIVAVVVLGIRYRKRIGELTILPNHIVAGVLLGAMNILFIVSLEFASVAFVLVLQPLSPLAAAYFSWLVMKERPAVAVLVATGLSIVGVVVMVWGSIAEDVSPYGFLALLIPVGFGLYATIVRSTERIDPMVPLLVGAIVLMTSGTLIVLSTGGFQASASDAATGLFAGSVLLAVPLAAFNVAQRVVPASETALLLMSEVVLAPLWVWLFMGESASVSTLIGGAIILAAVLGVMANRIRRRNRSASGEADGHQPLVSRTRSFTNRG